MTHGPLFPAQCREDVTRCNHQAQGQQDVHHDHQPGKFACRKAYQSEQQHGDEEDLLDNDAGAQRAQRVDVQVSEFQPPQAGQVTSCEGADQGDSQPDPHQGGELPDRIRQPADDEDGQKGSGHGQRKVLEDDQAPAGETGLGFLVSLLHKPCRFIDFIVNLACKCRIKILDCQIKIESAPVWDALWIRY